MGCRSNSSCPKLSPWALILTVFIPGSFQDLDVETMELPDDPPDIPRDHPWGSMTEVAPKTDKDDLLSAEAGG